MAVFSRRSEVVTELSVLHTPCREPPVSEKDARGAPFTTNSTRPSDDRISFCPVLPSTTLPPITASPPRDKDPAINVRDRNTPATARDRAAARLRTVALSTLTPPKTASVFAKMDPATAASPPSAARRETDNVSCEASVACNRRLVFNEVRIVASMARALPRRTKPRTESVDPKCRKSNTDRHPAARAAPRMDAELPMRQKLLRARDDPNSTPSRTLHAVNLPKPLTRMQLPTRSAVRTDKEDPRCKKSNTDRVAGHCTS
mmetsp:Transcript_50691/g.133618  ORF Transcript_50691/g.133618 Transcript_50691/m.133618 type:complete len:260 (-) Transcript_50691:1176-1955(-)